MIKGLYMGRLCLVIQLGPKSNHRCPESEAEGDLTHIEGHVATGPRMSTATRGKD